MKVEAGPSTRSFVLSQGRKLVLGVVHPKRGSGPLAFVQWLSVALCGLLGCRLLWLGLAQPHVFWRLIAFAVLFLSGGVYILAPFLPRPIAVAASLLGLAGLIVAVWWVQLSGA
jgi:hypothetical protein